MQRVAVVGCIGAGKSTLARAIGDRLGIDVIHLDRLWWQPGSYRIRGRRTVVQRTLSPSDYRRLQEDLVARQSWIIDGDAAHLDVRLARADTVIFLDLPRWLCSWRLIKRHSRPRPDYPEGVKEGVGWLLLLLRWIWFTYPARRRPAILTAIAEHAGSAQVLQLRTPRSVWSFLRRVDGDKGCRRGEGRTA